MRIAEHISSNIIECYFVRKFAVFDVLSTYLLAFNSATVAALVAAKLLHSAASVFDAFYETSLFVKCNTIFQNALISLLL